MKTFDTSVVIAGAGPVGLTLAHILAQSGVETIILEKASALPNEPRAVGLDPESLRTYQGLGLLDLLSDDILFGLTGDYLNGQGETLFELMDDQPGPLGYPPLNGFSQPNLVAKLAGALDTVPQAQLLYSHTLEGFTQTEQKVSLQVTDQTGEPLTIETKFLIGCDGGRSTVRETLGIVMQGESNSFPWLVIDTEETANDGKAKYRFFCDPARPGMFIQTPHANRRWEWMLMPGEDRQDLLRDENIQNILSPYVDTDQVNIYRRQIYDFHAIIADHFQDGRVFLAGDAAHMTPPFAGQGLNSGLRDVANLGWKLALVVAGKADRSLLDTYEQERWAHAKELIETAVNLGNTIQPTHPEAAAARDAGFAEMRKEPAVMDSFVGGVFEALLNRYFDKGCALDIDTAASSGRMITQPLVTQSEGGTVLLDEVLGQGFSIVGYDCDPRSEIDSNSLSAWKDLGATFVSIGSSNKPDTDFDLIDHTDQLARHFSNTQDTMFLLRPDKFCMAAFNSATAGDTLNRAVTMLQDKT